MRPLHRLARKLAQRVRRRFTSTVSEAMPTKGLTTQSRGRPLTTNHENRRKNDENPSENRSYAGRLKSGFDLRASWSFGGFKTQCVSTKQLADRTGTVETNALREKVPRSGG